MVGPPYSDMLCGGFFIYASWCRPTAAQLWSFLILEAEEGMESTTIFVIASVLLFLCVMIGFQIYIHTGKRDQPGADGKDKHSGRT